MKKRLECIVKGRVQMVMFRDFAQRSARRLGVFGFVKNLDDGSVLVVAEGEEWHLREFLQILKKGSVFSKVSEVREKWEDNREEFKDFTIKYD